MPSSLFSSFSPERLKKYEISFSAPNADNMGWVYNEIGHLQLRTNSLLCLSTFSLIPEYTAYPVRLAICDPDDVHQRFTLLNSTTDPTITISQNNSVLGTTGKSVVVFPADFGAGVFTCNNTDPSQAIFFTGNKINPIKVFLLL
jgi:hypothetical protein